MECQAAQFGRRADIEFAFEVFAVGVDHVRAEQGLIGDGTRRYAFADRPVNFFFPIAQA